MNNIEIARLNMIEQQVRPWEVLDQQVLSTLQQVNREDFVDPAYRGLAYADCQIPVANDVRMLPPTIEGRMLQALLLDKTDSVLTIGCASGYLAICIARMAGQVKGIDADSEIIELARANIERCGQSDIDLQQLNLEQLDAPSSYDAIAVTGSLAAVPENLKQALKIDGRLFIIVGQSPVMQALLVTRVGDSEWTTQSLFETDLPRLRQS